MSDLSKAMLQEIEAGRSAKPVAGTELYVQFNPQSLKLALANKVEGGDSSGRQKRQYLGKTSTTLTFDLVFDTADQGTTESPMSVRTQTAMVERFVLPKGQGNQKQAPPKCRFSWDKLVIDGIIEDITIDFELFAANGTPLRAKVGVTLKEQDAKYELLQTGAGANNAASATLPGQSGTGPGSAAGGPTDRSAQALGGESAADFAVRMGLDPGAWRGIAGQLGGGASLSLTAGASIGFSASLSADAGIGISAGVDVGAGTGRLTGLLKKRYPKAEVIALDLALGMLAQARRHASWWRPFRRVAGDAQALPFADGSMDLLVSNLCLQWCELPAALYEFRRVLRPGGRIALSVWGPRDEVPLIAHAQDCIARLLPAPKVPRPSVFRLGEADRLATMLEDAGFADVRIVPHRFTCRFDGADAYWQAFLDLAGGAAESLSRLPDSVQAKLRAEVANELGAHADGTGYAVESTVLIASARR